MDRFEEPLESGARWWVQDGVLVLRTGRRFTGEDMRQALTEAVASQSFRMPIELLLDNRFSEEQASAEEIRRRAQGLAQHRDLFGPRVATVVSDALHYGLARMGGAYAELQGLELQVFDTPAEALAWLKAQPAALADGREDARITR